MHDSEPVWVAHPSPYETFIHNTLPVLTGAPDHRMEQNPRARVRRRKTLRELGKGSQSRSIGSRIVLLS
jgi:hypothetical protein